MEQVDGATFDWPTIIGSGLTAIGVVTAAGLAHIGEPRRLKMMKLLNEVISSYGDQSQGGRESLLQAREDLSKRTSLHLLGPPWYLRAILWLSYVALAVNAAFLFFPGVFPFLVQAEGLMYDLIRFGPLVLAFILFGLFALGIDRRRKGVEEPGKNQKALSFFPRVPR